MTHKFIGGGPYIIIEKETDGCRTFVTECRYTRYSPAPIPHFYELKTGKKIALQQALLEGHTIMHCTPIGETP